LIGRKLYELKCESKIDLTTIYSSPHASIDDLSPQWMLPEIRLLPWLVETYTTPGSRTKKEYEEKYNIIAYPNLL
jgi:hypothetical protein